MARKKSHPTIKSSHHSGVFSSIPRPILQLYDSFNNWLILNPAYKKYKRLTSTPLGRIARDVVVVFTVVMIIIRWQTSPKYQYWYRNLISTGDLSYSRYVFNVSVTTNTYRSIIGEIESSSVRHSSEAVILLASGQKGCDSWNDTGILHKIFKTGYRAIALDPPGQGISTVGYIEPSSGGRVSQRDMGSYLKNVVKLLGVEKLVIVAADRAAAQALNILKEYPEFVKAICFLTPTIQQDRDPLVIKQYGEWLKSRRLPVLSISPKKDSDAKDSERVLDHLRHVRYEYVKYIGKLWFFEHHEDFEDIFLDWLTWL